MYNIHDNVRLHWKWHAVTFGRGMLYNVENQGVSDWFVVTMVNMRSNCFTNPPAHTCARLIQLNKM